MSYAKGSISRQAKSTEKIRDAFLSLMEEKHYSAITVTEITCAAGVNRATFYRCFKDVPDLLMQIEKGVIDTFTKIIHDFFGTRTIPVCLDKDILFLKSSETKTLSVLLSKNGDQSFVVKAVKHLLPQLYRIFAELLPDSDPHMLSLWTPFVVYGGLFLYVQLVANPETTDLQREDMMKISSRSVGCLIKTQDKSLKEDSGLPFLTKIRQVTATALENTNPIPEDTREPEKLSNSIKKTRQHLREALLCLLKHKSFDSITVKELAEKAEISESSFYNYYRSIHHLAACFLQQLSDDIVARVYKYIQDGDFSDPSALTKSLSNEIKTSLNLITATGSFSFYNDLFEKLYPLVSGIAVPGLKANYDPKLTLGFLVGGFFGLCIHQISTDAPIEHENISKICIICSKALYT